MEILISVKIRLKKKKMMIATIMKMKIKNN